MNSHANKSIEQFKQENSVLLQERMAVKPHPLLSYNQLNQLVRKKKPKFNPAWFPRPQETRPSKKDLVSCGNRQGVIVYVDYSMEEVGILFFNDGLEAMDFGCFYSHTSRGGRTRWLLDE